MIEREMYYMDVIHDHIFLPLQIASSRMYYIHFKIVLTEELRKQNYQLQGEIEIEDHTDKDVKKKTIFTRKFFNESIFNLVYENPNSKVPGISFCYLRVKFPDIDQGVFFSIKIDSLLLSIVRSLHTEDSVKKEIQVAVDKFMFKDYKGSLNVMGNIAERITKRLMEMRGKNWISFGGSIRGMLNLNPEQTDLNYRFLASQLAPLYALRNEVNHPEDSFSIHPGLVHSTIFNLSNVLYYCIDKEITF